MKSLLFSCIFSLTFLQLQNQIMEFPFTPPKPFEKLKEKSILAKSYCLENSMDTNFCLLMDASIHSGKYRLFIWSFSQDSIMQAGLCSHGCCDNPWGLDYSADKPKFSNDHGSHCSSLGKYKVGKRGWSNWGIHVNYQLHGLEETNSQANTRQIVLHGWNMISDNETYPSGTPEGWGCPAVSNNFMRILDNILQNDSKPILFWIFL
jgi:hypothetical protein